MIADGNQIQEFLGVLRRRRWQIFLPALYVFVIGSAFAAIVPKKYVVGATFEVKETRNPRDYMLKDRKQTALGVEIANLQQHIVNFARVKRIIGEDLIDHWPEYHRADQDTRSGILLAIMRNIDVDPKAKEKDAGSTFVDISYRDVEAERAAAFLDLLVKTWAEDVVARSEDTLEREKDHLDQELRSATQRYDEAMAAWNKLANEMGWNPMLQPGGGQTTQGQPAASFVYDELNDARQEREDIEGELARATIALEQARSRYEAEPDFVDQRQTLEGESPFAKEITRAQAEIQNLRAKLAGITPQNTQYDRYLRTISDLEAAIQEMLEKQTGASEIVVKVPNVKKEELQERVQESEDQLAAHLEEAGRLDEKITEYEDTVARHVEDYALLAVLWREKERASTEKAAAETELRDKEGTLRLEREANARVVEMSQPPLTTKASKEPNFWLIVAFSLFAGLAVGLALAVLIEYGRNSYRTVSDLSSVMTIPVVGAIGAIHTRFETRRASARRAMVGVSSTVILLAFAYLAVVLEFFEDKLPVSVLQSIESFRLMLM
jgi:hypothetical protein